MNFHFGSWSPDGLLNLQREISGVKTHWTKELFISLKIFLKCTCLKWACMTHLDTEHTSYSQNKGWGVKLAIWLPTTKSQESLDFLTCRWCVTYRWKIIDDGYNFVLNFISIKGVHAKLWAPKVVGVPVMKNSGLPFESLEIKWHLGVGHVARHKVYYKGEGDGFPQVRVVVSLVSLSLPVARPNIKSALVMH